MRRLRLATRSEIILTRTGISAGEVALRFWLVALKSCKSALKSWQVAVSFGRALVFAKSAHVLFIPALVVTKSYSREI